MGLRYTRAIEKFLTYTSQKSAEQKCIMGYVFMIYIGSDSKGFL